MERLALEESSYEFMMFYALIPESTTTQKVLNTQLNQVHYTKYRSKEDDSET